MYTLSSYQSYNTLFNSLKQLPPLGAPGLSNAAGAYMAAKYGGAVNHALSSNLTAMMKSVRSDTNALNSRTKDLSAQGNREALRTDDDAVSGTTLQTKKSTLSIQVDQLAAKQITQSSVLNAKQGTALAPGTSSLTLNTASKSFNVTISVAAGEKNSSVLSKTAQGINDLHAGFKARVAADSLGNRQLVVESEKTGKNNSFSIGGALGQSLGLDQVTQASADAAFTYNGKAYTTENNSVTLDDGDTRLDLRAVTDEPSVLNRSPDTSGLEDGITAVASAYNQLQETLKAAPDNKALQAVSRQLEQTVTRNLTKLETFGITLSEQGKLSIDTGKLNQSLQEKPDQARDLFLDRGSLTDQLQKKAEQLLKAPASALITPAAASPSPYQAMNTALTSAVASKTQSSGYLFDMFL